MNKNPLTLSGIDHFGYVGLDEVIMFKRGLEKRVTGSVDDRVPWLAFVNTMLKLRIP